MSVRRSSQALSYMYDELSRYNMKVSRYLRPGSGLIRLVDQSPSQPNICLSCSNCHKLVGGSYQQGMHCRLVTSRAHTGVRLDKVAIGISTEALSKGDVPAVCNTKIHNQGICCNQHHTSSSRFGQRWSLSRDIEL